VGYSSPTIATLHGVEQILIVNEATVAGHDPQTGAELWQYKWFGSSTGTASVAQPHAIDNNRVLITKGYGGGLTIFRVDRAANGKWSVVEEHKNPAALKTKFTNVAVLDGHAYALSDTILECVNLADGKAKWKKGRYGQGQLLAVGKLLLIQCESGEVALAEANPERPRELTRFAAIQGITWNNPCLYGRLLLVRNGDEAACYELPVEE
jgi:outer membrane protein assembly factor BamB